MIQHIFQIFCFKSIKFGNSLEKILKNKDKFNQILDKNYYLNISKNIVDDENCEKYLCPYDFDIIRRTTYIKFLQFLNLNIEEMNEYEVDLGFYKGNVVLKPKTNAFFKKYNNELAYLSYIYQVNFKNKNFIYKPKFIYEYYHENERNNHFKKIIKGKYFHKSNLIDIGIYVFKIINIDDDNFYNNANDRQIITPLSTANNGNNESKLNKFISYAIILYNEYSKIKKIKNGNNKSIFELFLFKQKEESHFFLVNNEYIEKIESILNFNKIKGIIEKYNMININLSIKDDYNNNNEINKIKSILNINSFNYEKYIDESYIENKLNDNNLYKLPIKEHNSVLDLLFYFYNCKIINAEILNILKDIDKNNNNLDYLKCDFSENKLIANYNNIILNLGFIDNNLIYIVENIIYSNNQYDIAKISEYIKEKGYNWFTKKKSNDNLIEFVIDIENNLKVNARIENLFEQRDEPQISNKLKTLIFLSIYSYSNNFNYNNNSYEKGFLMNRNWLKEYEYEEINCLIDNYYDIILDKVKKIKKNNKYELEEINDIINKLDIQTLLKIDKKIKQKTINLELDAEIDVLKFNEDENIYIYKNFFYVNYKIMDIFKKYFDYSFNCKDISYLNFQNNDFISMTHFSQFTIYIGKINKKNFVYNINYILKFTNYYDYIQQQKLLSKININDYFENRIVFNNNKTNDFISPIIFDNKIIGICYKYEEGINYNLCLNYYNLLNNDKLTDSIFIIFN